MSLSFSDYQSNHGSKLVEDNFWEYMDEAIEIVRPYTYCRVPDLERLEEKEPAVYK